MSETDRVMRAKYLRERHVDVRDNDTFDMAYQRYLKNNPHASGVCGCTLPYMTRTTY